MLLLQARSARGARVLPLGSSRHGCRPRIGRRNLNKYRALAIRIKPYGGGNSLTG